MEFELLLPRNKLLRISVQATLKREQTDKEQGNYLYSCESLLKCDQSVPILRNLKIPLEMQFTGPAAGLLFEVLHLKKSIKCLPSM